LTAPAVGLVAFILLGVATLFTYGPSLSFSNLLLADALR
jgi:hypothetical protein